jgi:MFS family permease
VTHGDESQVGHYVGILVSLSSSFLPSYSFLISLEESSYYAAHVLTVFHWSRLSDHIGRKPVILIALSAISLSMLSFGLSKTFLGLMVRSAC